MRLALALLFLLAQLAAAEESAYRWVQKLGGSGSESVVGIGTDSEGNSYIAGSTNSLDFPVRNALQPQRGAAPLYRGSLTGSPAAKLHSPGTYVGSVAVSQCHPSIVFALTEKEILKSIDSGETWTRFPASYPANTQIAATCVAGNDVVYVAADKLYRSSDLTTWDALTVGVTRAVNHLWIDPNDPQTMYANTDQGSLRSRDGGATWKVTGAGIINMSFVAGEPGVLYGQLFQYSPDSHIGPAKSTDYGDTWTALAAFPGRDTRPNTIIRDPRRANSIYAAGFISEDAGQSWRTVDSGIASIDIDYTTGTLLGVDPNYRTFWASTDGFVTKTKVIEGPNFGTLTAANGVVYVSTGISASVFVAKYSPAGERLYSTYFGGSGQDNASAMTVGKDGSVYVTGTTQSLDYPVTDNAYIRSTPNYSRFLFKLDPQGKLVFSTIIAVPGDNSRATTLVIAPDGGILVAGTSSGGLITTPGAYQRDFISSVPPSKFFFPSNAFVQRFRADGSAIDWGTYVGTDTASATGMVLLGDQIYTAGSGGIFILSADGSTLVSGTATRPLVSAGARIAANSAAHIYTWSDGGLDLWENGLRRMAHYPVAATSPTLALDRDGTPLLAGATGYPLETFAPLQGPFALQTGVLASFNANLTPRVITFAGDTHPFQASGIAGLPDGGVAFTGSTLVAINNNNTQDVYVGVLDLRVPPIRLDTIRNAASFVANPVAALETLLLTGGPFANDATVTAEIESSGGITVPVTILSRTSATLTIELDPGMPTRGTLWLSVQSGGVKSNTVKMPISAASPGIYSTDRTGKGQAVVFNKDGVPNDPDHPAIEGDPITVYATGGTPQIQPSLYVGGIYANGIDAKLEPSEGYPGSVYKLSVFMPPITQIILSNPDVHSYTLPPTLPIHLTMDGVTSQNDVIVSVKAK
jgi:hypothetical protein